MIYLASSLFTEAERAFSAALTGEIEALGYPVYNPWRDAGDASLIAAWGEDWPRVNAEIACRNLRALEGCASVVAIVEGADVESGVAMEIGYAHALGKPVKLLRTDFRTQGPRIGPVNLMLGTAAEGCHSSVESLLADLRSPAVARFYDQVAAEYSDGELHPTTRAFKKAEEAVTAEILADRRFRAALDIGCGDGNFLYNVSADRKTGVDVSVEMIRRHHQRLPKATFLLADCQHPLPLAPAAFDVIHCSFVLDHLKDAEACLREIRRLVAADGLIVLALYSPSLFQQDDGDVLRYRTASGTVLPVYRSFRNLINLEEQLAVHFSVEHRQTIPIEIENLSFDHYLLRPNA